VHEEGLQTPGWKRTGNLKADLRARAESIRGINIVGRIWLSIHGRKLPSVKVNAWLYAGRDMRLLRFRGYGPFGMTVFDLLADDGEAWIYLPKEGKVYKGNEWATSYGRVDIETALRVAQMCLNPWSPVMHTYFREIPCPGTAPDIECLSGRMLGRRFRLEYNRDSLAHVGFCARDVEIEFKSDHDRAGMDYPSEIIFSMKREGISGRLKVKKAKFNNISANSSLFDRERYSFPRK